VVVSIIVLSVTPLGDLGFKNFGALPQGWPDFRLPDWQVRDVWTSSPVVDLAGARMLVQLHGDLKAAGIRLRLVAAHAAMLGILRAEGPEESIGYFGRRITMADVIDEFQGHPAGGAA